MHIRLVVGVTSERCINILLSDTRFVNKQPKITKWFQKNKLIHTTFDFFFFGTDWRYDEPNEWRDRLRAESDATNLYQFVFVLISSETKKVIINTRSQFTRCRQTNPTSHRRASINVIIKYIEKINRKSYESVRWGTIALMAPAKPSVDTSINGNRRNTHCESAYNRA